MSVFDLFRKQVGTITVNGRTYTGKNVSIKNGRVIVDGVTQDGTLEAGPVNVTVNGDVAKLSNTSGSVVVNGCAGMVEVTSGDVTCGDVAGNVETTSGNVKCGNVTGKVSTVSGNIKGR